MIEIIDCAQNSPEWLQARCGLPTASAFSSILAKGEGKTRRTYMMKLAGEILTGQPAENFSTVHTERGHTMEEEARDLYALQADAELLEVGFIKNGDKGCSPDRLIGNKGGLEVKTKLPHLLIEVLLKGEVPPEHKAQIQGCMWVTDREWWDICIYWPKLPLFVKRVKRDDGYIANLAGAVKLFNEELAETVAKIRAYQ